MNVQESGQAEPGIRKNFFLGVDPGVTGVASVIDEQARIVSIHEHGTAQEDTAWAMGIKAMADALGATVHVAIEEVTGDPTWGMARSTALISTRWQWAGICTAVFYPDPVTTIRPADWQRTHWPIQLVYACKSNKKRSLAVARHLWPQEAAKKGRLALEKHHDRADSLLLADRLRATLTMRPNPLLPLRP